MNTHSYDSISAITPPTRCKLPVTRTWMWWVSLRRFRNDSLLSQHEQWLICFLYTSHSTALLKQQNNTLLSSFNNDVSISCCIKTGLAWLILFDVFSFILLIKWPHTSLFKMHCWISSSGSIVKLLWSKIKIYVLHCTKIIINILRSKTIWLKGYLKII